MDIQRAFWLCGYMVGCIISPMWRQFVCRRCSRVISDCRPAGIPNSKIPTIEEIDSYAVCAREPTRSLKTHEE